MRLLCRIFGHDLAPSGRCFRHLEDPPIDPPPPPTEEQREWLAETVGKHTRIFAARQRERDGVIVRPLHKTTIVIWSEDDPTNVMELEELAREATVGAAYCSLSTTKLVPNPATDPDWDGTEFFEEV